MFFWRLAPLTVGSEFCVGEAGDDAIQGDDWARSVNWDDGPDGGKCAGLAHGRARNDVGTASASVDGWIRWQEELQQEVWSRVRPERQAKQKKRSVRKLPVFEPGDYELLTRPMKLKSAPKLVLKWAGPWQVVSGKAQVYVVRGIVTDETC